MRSLRDSLPRALASLGISRKTREAQALWLWPQVVGSLLAEQSRALRLSAGTLWISTTSTALAHQLHLEQQGLIDRLNAAIGAPAVREIRFKQGTMP